MSSDRNNDNNETRSNTTNNTIERSKQSPIPGRSSKGRRDQTTPEQQVDELSKAAEDRAGYQRVDNREGSESLKHSAVNWTEEQPDQGQLKTVSPKQTLSKAEKNSEKMASPSDLGDTDLSYQADLMTDYPEFDPVEFDKDPLPPDHEASPRTQPDYHRFAGQEKESSQVTYTSPGKFAEEIKLVNEAFGEEWFQYHAEAAHRIADRFRNYENLENELNNVREERDHIKEELTNYQTAYIDANKSKEKYFDQAKQLGGEVTSLKQELSTCGDENSKLNSEINRIKGKYKELNAIKMDLEEKVKKHELSMLSEVDSRLEEVFSDPEKVKGSLGELEAKALRHIVDSCYYLMPKIRSDESNQYFTQSNLPDLIFVGSKILDIMNGINFSGRREFIDAVADQLSVASKNFKFLNEEGATYNGDKHTTPEDYKIPNKLQPKVDVMLSFLVVNRTGQTRKHALVLLD